MRDSESQLRQVDQCSIEQLAGGEGVRLTVPKFTAKMIALGLRALVGVSVGGELLSPALRESLIGVADAIEQELAP